MTDEELITALRMRSESDLCREAADRIETLVKERDDLQRRCTNAEAAILPLCDERDAAEAEVEKLREVERAARKLEENLGVEGVNVGSLRVDLYRALAALKGDDHE